MNKRLIAYAQSFVAFVLDELKEESISVIKSIILFGSATRGTATKSSDVDIFINTSAKLDNKIGSLLSDFYKSKSGEQWKLLGVKNELNPIVGELDNWELKSSIVADGIVLYGKYSAKLKGAPHIVLFWDKIKSESKRVLLSKRLYGYTYNKKKYEGLLSKLGGEKLASNCLLIPIVVSKQFIDLFKRAQIPVKQILVEVVR